MVGCMWIRYYPIKRIDSLIEKYDDFNAIHCWETESDESWKKISNRFFKFNLLNQI